MALCTTAVLRLSDFFISFSPYPLFQVVTLCTPNYKPYFLWAINASINRDVVQSNGLVMTLRYLIMEKTESIKPYLKGTWLEFALSCDKTKSSLLSLSLSPDIEIINVLQTATLGLLPDLTPFPLLNHLPKVKELTFLQLTIIIKTVQCSEKGGPGLTCLENDHSKKVELSAVNKIFKISSFWNSFAYAKETEMRAVREFVWPVPWGINESLYIKHLFLHSCKILFTRKSYWNTSCFHEQPKEKYSCSPKHCSSKAGKTARKARQSPTGVEWWKNEEATHFSRF